MGVGFSIFVKHAMRLHRPGRKIYCQFPVARWIIASVVIARVTTTLLIRAAGHPSRYCTANYLDEWIPGKSWKLVIYKNRKKKETISFINFFLLYVGFTILFIYYTFNKATFKYIMTKII